MHGGRVARLDVNLPPVRGCVFAEPGGDLRVLRDDREGVACRRGGEREHEALLHRGLEPSHHIDAARREPLSEEGAGPRERRSDGDVRKDRVDRGRERHGLRPRGGGEQDGADVRVTRGCVERRRPGFLVLAGGGEGGAPAEPVEVAEDEALDRVALREDRDRPLRRRRAHGCRACAYSARSVYVVDWSVCCCTRTQYVSPTVEKNSMISSSVMLSLTAMGAASGSSKT